MTGVTPPASARQVFAIALDGLGLAAATYLLWRAMFGNDIVLSPLAFQVGVLTSLACLVAPGAARRTPWPVIAYVAVAVVSAAMHDTLWVRPSGMGKIDSIPPYPVIIAVLGFGLAYTFRSPGRIAVALFALLGCVSVLGTQILYDRFLTNMLYERGGSISMPLVEQWGGLHQTGLLFVIVLPIALSVALVGRGVAQRAAGGVMVLGLMAIGFINGSRTGVLVMALTALAMMLLVLVRRGTGWRTWAMAAALVAEIGLAGIAGERVSRGDGPIALTLKILEGNSTRPVIELVTGDRWPIWQAAAAVTMDHPVFGAGIGRYSQIMREGGYAAAYLPGHPEVQHAGAGQAHNMVLHAAVEMGVPGAVCVIAIWFWMTGTAWRSWRAGRLPVISLGLAGATGAFFMRSLADSFLDGLFTADRTAVIVALLLGLTMALGRRHRQAQQ